MADNSFFNIFFDKTKKSKQSYKWEEFVEYISDELDNVIISHARKNALIYIGGKCRFTSTMEKDEFNKQTFINVDAELYFKEQFKEGKNIEIYPLHMEKSYLEFDMTDEETVSIMRGLFENPIENNVAIPIIKEENNNK